MALNISSTPRPELIGDIQPGWSVEEAVTPHAIGDGTASVGGVSFSAQRMEDSEFLQNKPVTVQYQAEGAQAPSGSVSGTFKNVQVTGPTVTADVSNALSGLNVERRMPPIVGGAEYENFTDPVDLGGVILTGASSALDSNGDVYALDISDNINRVVKYNSAGEYQYAFSVKQDYNYISISPNGNLYLGGSASPAVYTKNGRYLFRPGGPLSAIASGKYTFDTAGNAYVYSQSRRVIKTSPNGNLLGTFGSTGTGAGQFSTTLESSVVADGSNFYVLNRDSFKVQRFTLAGVFVSEFAVETDLLKMEAYGSNLLLSFRTGGEFLEYTKTGVLSRRITAPALVDYSVSGSTLAYTNITGQITEGGSYSRTTVNKISLPAATLTGYSVGAGSTPVGIINPTYPPYYNPVTQAIGITDFKTSVTSEYSVSGERKSVRYDTPTRRTQKAVVLNDGTIIRSNAAGYQSISPSGTTASYFFGVDRPGIIDFDSDGENIYAAYRLLGGSSTTFYVGKFSRTGELLYQSPGKAYDDESADPSGAPKPQFIAYSPAINQAFLVVKFSTTSTFSAVDRVSLATGVTSTVLARAARDIRGIQSARGQGKIYLLQNVYVPPRDVSYSILEINTSGGLIGAFTLGPSSGTAPGLVNFVALPGGRIAVTSQDYNNVRIFTDSESRLATAFSIYSGRASGREVVYQASSNPIVTYPGWTDNVWSKLNELCAATNTEIVLVNEVVVVRDNGKTSIDISDYAASPSHSIESNGAGRSIEVVNQNTKRINSGIIFDYSVDPGRPFGADVGEFSVTNIKLDTWLTDVRQPTVTAVLPGRRVPTGTYAVIDNNKLPVNASQWTQYGGAVSVSIGEDGTSLDISVTGPGQNIPGYEGPYAVATQIGASNSTGISIIGSGVQVNPQTLTIATGADPDLVTDEIAQSIDIPFLTNASQCYDQAAWAGTYLNGTNSGGSMTLPMSAIGGLGIVCGSVFTMNKCKWRVMSANVRNSTVDIDYVRYATVADHQAAHQGQTVAQHDASLAGLSIGDSTIKPLY